MEEALLSLAPKFRAVKFIKIRSTQAVENWPDKNLPTIFAYNQGELQQQMLTARTLGGDAMRAEDLEWWLAEKGIVEGSELEEDPASRGKTVQRQYGKHTTQTASVYDDEDDEYEV